MAMITGQPIDRRDGRLKVTGGATYAAEFAIPAVVHANGCKLSSGIRLKILLSLDNGCTAKFIQTVVTFRPTAVNLSISPLSTEDARPTRKSDVFGQLSANRLI